MNDILSSKDLEHLLEPNDWKRLQQQVRSHAAKMLPRPAPPRPSELKSKLYPLDDIRAVLFDVYGTLLLSEAGETSTAHTPQHNGPRDDAKRALDFQALHSLPEQLRAALHQDFSPSEELQQSIWQQHQKNTSVQYPEVDIISLWQDIFRRQLDKKLHVCLRPFVLARFALEYELWHNPVQLLPGTAELLHWLASRNFYIGIISNAQFYTPIILCALLNSQTLADLHIRSELCFWSYRCGCSKPQEQIFAAARLALARHELRPQEVLYLGNDMRNDVWGAEQIGCRTALFAGDRRSLRLRRELAKITEPDITEPDIVVTKIEQLKIVL